MDVSPGLAPERGESGLERRGEGALEKTWCLRSVLETEPTGRDTELDGDEGKEGSRMTLGICLTDTLSPLTNTAGSRLFIHLALFVVGKFAYITTDPAQNGQEHGGDAGVTSRRALSLSPAV